MVCNCMWRCLAEDMFLSPLCLSRITATVFDTTDAADEGTPESYRQQLLRQSDKCLSLTSEALRSLLKASLETLEDRSSGRLSSFICSHVPATIFEQIQKMIS